MQISTLDRRTPHSYQRYNFESFYLLQVLFNLMEIMALYYLLLCHKKYRYTDRNGSGVLAIRLLVGNL